MGNIKSKSTKFIFLSVRSLRDQKVKNFIRERKDLNGNALKGILGSPLLQTELARITEKVVDVLNVLNMDTTPQKLLISTSCASRANSNLVLQILPAVE